MTRETDCITCGRKYTYNPDRGHTRERCNSCVAHSSKRFFKQQVVEHLGGKCVRCGYDKCLASLHAHHKDPSQKRFDIGQAACRKWPVVVRELEGCELLCANCHGEEHSGAQWNNFFAKAGASHSTSRPHKACWPKRSRLMKMASRTPLSVLAKKLHVSDVAVAKHCKKLGIKTRQRGGWGRNQYSRSGAGR